MLGAGLGVEDGGLRVKDLEREGWGRLFGFSSPLFASTASQCVHQRSSTGKSVRIRGNRRTVKLADEERFSGRNPVHSHCLVLPTRHKHLFFVLFSMLQGLCSMFPGFGKRDFGGLCSMFYV
jgi:hypothetical protein